jgi:phospholipid/cholesterol/gamma-HCH transport system ATP-binding protein
MTVAAGAVALELQQVGFVYGTRQVLDRVSLRVPTGGAVAICGANGIGKSALVHLCAGLEQPTSGRVLIAGHDTARQSIPALVEFGVRIGFVFQQGGLLSNLSVLANVAMPLAYHRRALGLARAEISSRARQCLGSVGVGSDDWTRLPAHVSEGIRKRVAIARILALEPNLLFFDDPMAGLEPDHADAVGSLVIELLQRPDVTVVVATTTPDHLGRAGADVYRLADGRLTRIDVAEASR